MRHLALIGLLALAAGCSTTSTPTASRPCIDVSRPVRSFRVIDAQTVEVVQSSYHAYRVEVEDCPNLAEADGISFATGTPRYLGRGPSGEPLWGNPVDGGQVCGRGFDRLVVHDMMATRGLPDTSCKIRSITPIAQ